jgi:hypothetical protein
VRRRRQEEVDVLTPPVSVAALAHGYVPTLHRSAWTGPGKAAPTIA